MKILDIKSNTIQKKSTINENFGCIKVKEKRNSDSVLVTQDINIKNFKDTVVKLKVEEDLDVETIQKLRAEINSNNISSEIIADSMITHLKNTSWHRNL